MCRFSGETVNHLLWHCSAAFNLWCFGFKSFGIQWVQPRTVIDLLFGRWNWFSKHSSYVWDLVPLCLMRTVWRERNRHTFEKMESSRTQLIVSFTSSLFDQSWEWGFTNRKSIAEFIVFTPLCIIQFHYNSLDHILFILHAREVVSFNKILLYLSRNKD